MNPLKEYPGGNGERIAMQRRLLILVVCVGGLLILLPAKLLIGKMFASSGSLEQPPVRLSVNQLHKLAESITVKVLSGEVLGSGIVIHKQGSVYTVLTNEHVLRIGTPPYQIQTSDGQVYAADSSKVVYFKGNDLALLKFHSNHATYAVASFGTSLAIKDEVFAAGFPFSYEPSQDKGFAFKNGQVRLVLDKPLEGGYRIGYNNDIEEGMSGGPLLNRAGEVVAINGMHAEPVWGEPYVYKDGTEPEPLLRKQMSQFSWGIPIETFVQLVPPSFMNNDSRFLLARIYHFEETQWSLESPRCFAMLAYDIKYSVSIQAEVR